MNESNDESDVSAPICIYPFEANRSIIAMFFAKRICSGMSNEKEAEFMCKFMDMEIDDGWFEDVSDYVAAVESVSSAA